MFGTYQLLLVFIQNEKNVFAFIFIGNTFKCFYEKYNLHKEGRTAAAAAAVGVPGRGWSYEEFRLEKHQQPICAIIAFHRA